MNCFTGDITNNNNNPLFILGYIISIASLHHGPVPHTKEKPIVKNYESMIKAIKA